MCTFFQISNAEHWYKSCSNRGWVEERLESGWNKIRSRCLLFLYNCVSENWKTTFEIIKRSQSFLPLGGVSKIGFYLLLPILFITWVVMLLLILNWGSMKLSIFAFELYQFYFIITMKTPSTLSVISPTLSSLEPAHKPECTHTSPNKIYTVFWIGSK